MTKAELIAIIENFQKLAAEYAARGQVEVVENINNSILAVVKANESVLKQ